jgi:predicted phosphohydrolase
MNIRFIGDVHGLWTSYRRIITDCEFSIQVGDFGIGFPGWEKTDPQKFKGDHYFIRGNHDNPMVCQQHPNYLGDYGFREEWGKLFYFGGAYSVDAEMRIPGRDWWYDEEIKYGEMLDKVLPLFEQTKPRIVVTHDAPKVIRDTLFSAHMDEKMRTRTVKLCDTILEIHQPDFWIHGHHHTSKRQTIGPTTFISLSSLEFYDLTI